MSFIALSYSKLSNYEKCPRQFQSIYITKTYPKDDNNPHFARGSRIHGQLEDYVVAKLAGQELPDMTAEAAGAIPMIEQLFEDYPEIYPEQKISVDKDFNKVNWFDKTTYYRAIFDLVAFKGDTAILIDWKTGKVREYDDHDTGQLHLAATILMSMRPEIKQVHTAYVFLDHKHTITKTFKREDLETMVQPFHKAFDKVNADKDFHPKVNKYCFFCNISSVECEFKK
jgi:hypothetical protein